MEVNTVLMYLVRAQELYCEKHPYNYSAFNRWLNKNWGIDYRPAKEDKDLITITDPQKHLLFILRFSA